MAGLTEEQLAEFSDLGFVIVEDLLPSDVLDRIEQDITDIIDDLVDEAHGAGRLPERFDGDPFDLRLANLRNVMGEDCEFERAVTGKNLRSAGMFSLMTCGEILDLVDSVIGPEILVHPQFNCQAKFPRESESMIPWHQDLGFLDPSAEETTMVNFWIPLVNATVENGCLEVLTRSHRFGLKPHGEVTGYPSAGILEGNVPQGAPRACPVKRGSAVVFQHRTIHRSFPNRSERIRWSVDIRYCDPRLPTGRDEVPGFVGGSFLNPASVTTSHLEWERNLNGIDPEPFA